MDSTSEKGEHKDHHNIHFNMYIQPPGSVTPNIVRSVIKAAASPKS